MENYLKSTKFNIGDSFYIQVDDKLMGNKCKFEHAYEVKFLTGYNIYTIYLFPLSPLGNQSLMCAEIGLTPMMYEIIPKYEKYREYIKYAEKSWPRFIDSYKRGINSVFTPPSLYPMYDVVENDGSLCWALVQIVDWNIKDDWDINKDHITNSIHDFLCYARDLMDEINNNDIDELDKLKVTLSEMGKGVVDAIKIYRKLSSIFGSELDNDTE